APVEVRLAGGGAGEGVHQGVRTVQGRVEVNYMGIWGSVCDDFIGTEEAHVLCRMLGWERALYVYKNNTFGPGSGPVWLKVLKCRGNETNVVQCQRALWGHTNCDHTEDLGLRCSNNPT
ncbi:hypothetical protein OTU49_002137, partial [Cherax quadricarinatus]